MKVLLDTNIIIDAVTGREPWNKEAEQIFILSANRFIDSYITSSSVTDIYYLIRKHLHDIGEAKKVMGKIFSLFTIAEVTSVDCIDALQLDIKDYEDAVVANCASRNDIEYIITRNVKDFMNSSVKAIQPKVFLQKFE